MSGQLSLAAPLLLNTKRNIKELDIKQLNIKQLDPLGLLSQTFANIASPKDTPPTIDAPILAADVPDVSPAFQSELGAIQAHYASRIAAARSSGLPPAMSRALLQALRDEQSGAVRSLMDRWQAAARNRALLFQLAPRPSPSRPN